MAGFDWAQFRALFGAIRKGEERSSDGMGNADGGAAGSSRVVGLLMSFVVIAVMMLNGGLELGRLGVSVQSGFELSVMALIALSLTTGFYTAVSSLFFSGDVAFYLTLPIDGTTIVWAKLANFMVGMTAVDLAILPLSLGILIGRGEGPLTWVLMIVAFLVCCVAINVALVLVALPIVRFSKLVADKDRFARVFGVVSAVLAIAIVLMATMGSFDDSGEVDVNAVAGTIQGISSMPAARVAFCLLCPPFALGGLTFGATGAPALGVLGMALLAACYVALLSVLSGRWYFDAVRGMAAGSAGSGHGRYQTEELAREVGSRSQFKAFFSVNVAQLVRVPAFFNQFVMSMWMVPAIMGMCGLIGVAGSSEGASLEMIRASAAQMVLDGYVSFSPLFMISLFSLFCGMLSFVFMRLVSMDGQDFFLFRTMPCDYGSYLMAKYAALALVGRGPVVLLLLVGMLVMGLPVATTLALLLFFVLAVGTSDLVALAWGAHKPNLGWTSEAELSNSGESFMYVILSLLISLVTMVIPLACAILPIIAGLDWGPVPVLLALVVLAAEFLAARACACGPAARKLASIEP